MREASLALGLTCVSLEGRKAVLAMPQALAHLESLLASPDVHTRRHAVAPSLLPLISEATALPHPHALSPCISLPTCLSSSACFEALCVIRVFGVVCVCVRAKTPLESRLKSSILTSFTPSLPPSHTLR